MAHRILEAPCNDASRSPAVPAEKRWRRDIPSFIKKADVNWKSLER